MNKKFILAIVALLFVLKLYPNQRGDDKKIELKGDANIISKIEVKISSHTLSTTFNRNANDVIITVKKKSGEIVYQQIIDAQELDEVAIPINDYKEGEYVIEISSPQGTAQGKF